MNVSFVNGCSLTIFAASLEGIDGDNKHRDAGEAAHNVYFVVNAKFPYMRLSIIVWRHVAYLPTSGNMSVHIQELGVDNPELSSIEISNALQAKRMPADNLHLDTSIPAP